MEDKEYYLSDENISFNKNQLKYLDREKQIAIMRDWFLGEFEDPVENTPYESAEGGYQFIWGGPYDPREALDGEFGEIIPEDVIEELSGELMQTAVEWARPPREEDYEESYLLDRLSEIYEPYVLFQESIDNVENLLNLNVNNPFHENLLYKMLYVNVITSIETFLSDLFFSAIKTDKQWLKQFVETTPEFKSQKISLSEIFITHEEIEKKVFSYLTDIVWHHFHRIKPMFKETLNISFPDDLKDLFIAINIRHDIVHRNGKKRNKTKTDSDEFHIITKDMVLELIEKANAFVNHINREWSRKQINAN